jgi:L-cysteine/cystine lyase
VSAGIERLRAEFPVLERLAYLNAGTFGPLPRRTAEAQTAWLVRALEDGRAGHPFFLEVLALRDELRARLGGLIGAPPEAMALTTSTTEGCNIVVAGLGLGPGDEVVTTDSEHPGLLGPLRTSGARVRVARVSEVPAGGALEAIEREITPATRLVALSHVLWTTGHVMPLEELAGREFHLLVDGAQGAGAIPVDVGALGCDSYTISGQKWLCGPDTTGALYLSPERAGELAMRAASYMSWEDVAELEPWPGARRHESVWLPPGSVAGLLASLDLADEAGVERFAAAGAATERCRGLVAERADLVTEPDQGTLVSFRPRGSESAEVVERLAERGVVVRELPGTGFVRASCGWWTNEDDLTRLAEGLPA